MKIQYNRRYSFKSKVNLIFRFVFVCALVLSGCQVQIDPREQQYNWPPPDPESPLLGTKWSNPEYGGRKLYFETPDLVLYTRMDVSSNKNYLYDKEKFKGEIETLGPFTVTKDYRRMTFSNIEGYGHHMDFTRE